MPPKIYFLTLIAKRDSTIASLNDLFEFHVFYQVEPLLSGTLSNVQKQVKSKQRSVKKQQDTIADRLTESASEELQTKNQVVGDEAKAKFLKYAERFAIYQKSFVIEKLLFKQEVLKAMTSVVTKMTDVLSLQKYTGQRNCQFPRGMVLENLTQLRSTNFSIE